MIKLNVAQNNTLHMLAASYNALSQNYEETFFEHLADLGLLPECSLDEAESELQHILSSSVLKTRAELLEEENFDSIDTEKLGEVIYDEIHKDDVSFDDIGISLLNQYRNASEIERMIINRTCVNLIGWELKTLFESAQRETPPLVTCQDCWEGRGIKENGEICDTCGGTALVSEGEPGSEGYGESEQD